MDTKDTKETLLRHWAMLRMIPRYPQKISTTELKKKLAVSDYPITMRTIQRDLNELSREFPFTSDSNKPAGWFWEEDAKLFNVPGMDKTEALTFCMVDSFLSHMLPKGCLSAISAHLKQAHKVLEQIEGASLQSWPSKVRTVHPAQPRIAADVLPEVMNTVYEALFHDRQMIGDYTPLGKETKEYVVNPLGLVFRDPTIYLVGSFGDHQDARSLPLHRFSSARMLEDACSHPENFDLDQFVEESFAFLVTENADKIKLQFHTKNKYVAQRLKESPLSVDQEIKPKDEETVTITATVHDTHQLRSWLLGFGEQIEIVKPAAMRKYFAELTGKMYQLYSDH